MYLAKNTLIFKQKPAKKIFSFLVLFMFVDSAFSCCCTSVSCKFVKITVSAAVSKTIKKLKQNDIELYSKKLQELNNAIKDINDLETKIKANEKKLIPVEKVESFYILQKQKILKKIIKAEELLILTNKILFTSKANENDLLLLNLKMTN